MGDGLGQTTPFDRFSGAWLDVVSAVPVAGPIIAAVARQVLPKDSLIYLRDFAVEAAQQIEQLEEARLDREFLSDPAFVEDLEQVLEAQVSLRQRRKREHFLAALVNTATDARPGEAERRRMLDTLVRLRPSHLSVLAAVVTAGEHPSPAGSTDDYLHERLSELPTDGFNLDWGDLQREGMVSTYPGGLAITPIWQRVGQALTPLGRRFAAFIEAT
jgi:hypothetical protein